MTYIEDLAPFLPDGVAVSEAGGIFPVQVIGTIGGRTFYLRARDGKISLDIGADPVDYDTEWSGEIHIPAQYAAGLLGVETVGRCLMALVALYRETYVNGTPEDRELAQRLVWERDERQQTELHEAILAAVADGERV